MIIQNNILGDSVNAKEIFHWNMQPSIQVEISQNNYVSLVGYLEHGKYLSNYKCLLSLKRPTPVLLITSILLSKETVMLLEQSSKEI